MTAPPLAPVIPSSAVPAARRRARSSGGRPLPLPRPVRPVPQDVVYGIARIDSSGRICERAIIAVLGWAGGDLLTFTADAGVVRRSGALTMGTALAHVPRGNPAAEDPRDRGP